MSPEDEIRDVKRRHSAEMLGIEGVSGFGVEKNDLGQYVLTVHLDSDDPAVRRRVPNEIEGYPVKVVFSGPFQKFATQ